MSGETVVAPLVAGCALAPPGKAAEERGFRRGGSAAGFTLIESLVALAILSVMVGVLVRVHLQTMRAAEFSRLRGATLLETETILTGSMLGSEPKALVEEAGQQGWNVTAQQAGTPGSVAYTEWRVAVSNPAAPVVSMVLRDGMATGAVTAAGR